MSAVETEFDDGVARVRFRDGWREVRGEVHPPASGRGFHPALITLGRMKAMTIEAAECHAGALLCLIKNAKDLTQSAASERASSADLSRAPRA